MFIWSFYPFFVLWSNWIKSETPFLFHSTHWFICLGSAPSAHSQTWIWVTMSMLMHVHKGSSLPVCISFRWPWKAGDTVTSNEERTSHPIGCSLYLESRPLWQKHYKISSDSDSGHNKKSKCTQRWRGMHVSRAFNSMTDDLLLSEHSGTNFIFLKKVWEKRWKRFTEEQNQPDRHEVNCSVQHLFG